jgi:hypothetical protein
VGRLQWSLGVLEPSGSHPAGKCLRSCLQEPESQYLRFEMFDTDFVNAKQLLKVNVLKGAADTINSKETMGKGQVDLRDLCVNHPGEDYEAWFPLGSDDWAEDDGPVGSRCLATALHCTTLLFTSSTALAINRLQILMRPCHKLVP